SVRETMQQAAVRSRPEAPGDPAPEIDLIGRSAGHSAEHSVAAEAHKGYDLLVIGMEPLLGARSSPERVEVEPRIAAMAQDFEQALCIVVARGRDVSDPVAGSRHILLPVIGSSYSREAADLALALAETSGATVTALAVALVRERLSFHRRLTRSFTLAEAADTVLRDVLDLSRHHSVPLHTAIDARAAPEDAILGALRSGRYDLLVIGAAGARPGDPVFSDGVPAVVLERAGCSTILVCGRK
ncbi:MAG: universal stress protein, partial [Steroidobacteraceae bacterium]